MRSVLSSNYLYICAIILDRNLFELCGTQPGKHSIAQLFTVVFTSPQKNARTEKCAKQKFEELVQIAMFNGQN